MWVALSLKIWLDFPFETWISSSQNDVEAAVVRDNPEKEIGRNSGYLVLFLIVLGGLLGGRVLALLLTTTCCLMLKLFKKPITLLT